MDSRRLHHALHYLSGWQKSSARWIILFNIAPMYCQARSSSRCWSELRLDLGHAGRSQALQEPLGRIRVEHRIGRLDAEEEMVARCQLEARHVEDRVIR